MNELTAGITASRVLNSSARAAFVAIGIASLSLLSANAGANPWGTPSERVDFQDLDLSKPTDAKRLYARLRLAASQVCVGYPGSGSSLRNSPRSRCESAAISNAVEVIAHPNLTALHAAKSDAKLAQQKAKPTTNS